MRYVVEGRANTAIAERSAGEADFWHNHDALTGLPNRPFLSEQVAQACAAAAVKNSVFALIFVGIDNFKLINASIDYDAGDILLQQFAARLQTLIAATGFLARIGGDEFAIVLNISECLSDLGTYCQQIRDVCDAPFLLNENPRSIDCSVGVAIYPKDADQPKNLFKYAGMALQRAKELGRANSQFFSDEINERTQERVMLESALRDALARNELRLHYQPLVDLQTGKICGMEALARWEHPQWGTVPPSRFIQIAEESSLILDLGNWVIGQACRDIRGWLNDGVGDCRVAINVSSRQLHDSRLSAIFMSALSELNISPDLLCLEITETVLMQDTSVSASTLREFKALGFDLVLDDFGTGFSSLSYLKRFSFHKVKIDRSFVKDVISNSDDAALSKAIISMAHSLGIRVVAEGVETEAQCAFLSQNMCDEIQGLLYSDALPPEQIGDLLKQDRRLPADLLRFQKPKQTLLLVDDEQNILGALRRLLRGGDFQILTANSGQAGLDVLAQNPVDVIVSDQRMPGMTGVEFLGIAKDLYPDTVRIVLSGYTELQSVTEAVNQGAIYKFLTKPWDDEQLRGHIEEAFRRKEMADENHRLDLEARTANQELAAANRQLEELLSLKQQQIIRDEVSLDIVREALQQIPLAVIGVDDGDMVVFANDAAQELFEQTVSILGSDVGQLIPDLDHAEDSGSSQRCTAELGACFYEVVARRMGHGSQSRGKLMTLTKLIN